MSSLLSNVSNMFKEKVLGSKKESWFDDSVSASCLICNEAFSMTLRKHHCRFCYRLVCGRCSSRTINDARACEECFRVKDRFDPGDINDGEGETIKVHSCL